MRSRLLGAVLVVAMAGCGAEQDGGRSTAPSQPPAETSPTAEAQKPSGSPDAPLRASGDPEVEVFATGLEIPWDLAVLPDGRMLVTERPGRVRLVERDGSVREEPVARVEVSAQGEGGLLGLDLDPQFAEGRPFAYLFATVGREMQVQRWRVAPDATMTQDAVVLGGIRAGRIHDSGRLRFGPDGNLYVVTGEAGQGRLAQDAASLNGKVLRLPPDQYRGTSARPQIVSLGHRNPQGLDWQPRTDRLVITDHGPSGFDGPSCCDEVDVVVEGGNYGWPEVFGAEHGRFLPPAMLWQETIAPAGAAFVTLPGSSWTGSYVVAALRGKALHRLAFTEDRVTGEETLLEDEYGRLRAVVEAPDGALYVTTSNRDGRGDPGDGDDRILRILPPAG